MRNFYQGRYRKLVIRLIALSVLSYAVVRLIPTSADTQQSTDYNNQLISDSSTNGAPMNSPDTATNSGADQNKIYPDVTSTDYIQHVIATESGTVTLTPTQIISNPSLIAHLPRTVPIDPRATLATLPAFNFAGDGYGEVCLSSPNTSITTNGPLADVYVDTFMSYQTDSGTITVPLAPTQIPAELGNTSAEVILTGTWPNILNTINGGIGTTVRSLSGLLGGKILTVQLLAVTEPSTDPANCSGGNTYTIPIQGLGISFSNSIGKLHLH